MGGSMGYPGEFERETSRTLTLGSVYKTLGRLEGKGDLQSRMGLPTAERGGRRKKFYVLTPAGLEAAQRSLSDLRSLTKGLEPELELP
jgi:DNA-binding PadR family transcriptional regulator